MSTWFEEADVQRAEVLRRLHAMSEDQQNARKRPGDWSALEVVTHLVQLDEAVAGEFRQAALAQPGARAGRKSRILLGVATRVMGLPIRLPSLPELAPRGNASLEELSHRWKLAAERMRSDVPTEADAVWVIHSAFGPQTCERMGRFLVAHTAYHLRFWPT